MSTVVSPVTHTADVAINNLSTNETFCFTTHGRDNKTTPIKIKDKKNKIIILYVYDFIFFITDRNFYREVCTEFLSFLLENVLTNSTIWLKTCGSSTAR